MFTKSNGVIKSQQLLNKDGEIPKLIEDGKFGKSTYNTVKIFQQHNGLKDGVVIGTGTVNIG